MPQEHALRRFMWQLVIDNNVFVPGFYLSPTKRSSPCICAGSRLVTHALHWTNLLRQRLMSLALLGKHGLFICTHLVYQRNKRDVIFDAISPYPIYHAVPAGDILSERILK